MYQILTHWVAGSSARNMVSVMHFEDDTAIDAVRSRLNAFWLGLRTTLHTDTQWRVANEGRIIDPTTGTMTGIWTDGVEQVGAGTAAAGGPVANATQALISWRTAAIVRGRRVAGRTFVPGLSAAAMGGGELSIASRGTFADAIPQIIGSPGDLLIWQRPTGASPGASHPVTSGSPGVELAVQRGRRG